MASASWLLLLLLAVAAPDAAAGQDGAVGGVDYAKIQMTVNQLPGSDGMQTSLVITGVYASYSPLAYAAGTLVAAAPFDGCGPLAAPTGLHPREPFVFLARLSPNSTCTAMEQSLNAERAGASGVVNMAPDGESNYIWILQATQRDANMRLPNPSIAHVAVSGISGTKLKTALDEAGGTIRIQANTGEEESELMVMDLAITIVCITVAVLVLMYAYRVGRSICISEEQFQEEMVNPETRERLRARVSEILIQDIPVSKYVPKESSNVGSDASCDGVDCAVCLDKMEAGEEVRKLSCDHFFHKVCIDPWLLEHHNCPLCKDDIITPRKSMVLPEIAESEHSSQLDAIIDEGESDLQPIELFPLSGGMEVVVHSHGATPRLGGASGGIGASLRQNAFEWQWSSGLPNHNSGEDFLLMEQPSSSMEATSGGNVSSSEASSSRRQDAV